VAYIQVSRDIGGLFVEVENAIRVGIAQKLGRGLFVQHSLDDEILVSPHICTVSRFFERIPFFHIGDCCPRSCFSINIDAR